MTPIVRAYLVTVAGEASRFERLILTPDAARASSVAIEDVFATERAKWADDDQDAENPFWIESVSLVARNDALNGATGIVIL